MGCHQRSGNAPGPPGCNGTPQDDWDYCYVVQAVRSFTCSHIDND